MFHLVPDISLDLFPGNCMFEMQSVSFEDARNILSLGPFKSGILDLTLAKLLEGLLDLPVNVASEAPRLSYGDDIVIAKYLGPSIPEGATTLPEGGRFIFFYLQHAW